MERKTFLTSASAAGAQELLSSLRSARLFGAGTSAGGPLPFNNTGSNYREHLPKGQPVGTLSDNLAPYTGTWGDAQIYHLLRRTMFGIPESQFQAAKALGSMNAIVSALLACQDTTAVPLPAKFATWLDDYPSLTGTTTDMLNVATLEGYKIAEIENWWFDQM